MVTKVSGAFLFLHPSDIIIIVIIGNDDKLRLNGTLILLAPPIVILSGLEAQEDCRDWLSGFHGAEDGVGGIGPVKGGGTSVRLSTVIEQGFGL